MSTSFMHIFQTVIFLNVLRGCRVKLAKCRSQWTSIYNLFTPRFYFIDPMIVTCIFYHDSENYLSEWLMHKYHNSSQILLSTLLLHWITPSLQVLHRSLSLYLPPSLHLRGASRPPSLPGRCLFPLPIPLAPPTSSHKSSLPAALPGAVSRHGHPLLP